MVFLLVLTKMTRTVARHDLDQLGWVKPYDKVPPTCAGSLFGTVSCGLLYEDHWV